MLSAHTWSSLARTPGIWGYSYPHDETTTFNVDFPAPASQKVATKPTRSVHPSSWLPPTSIPIFPHQKAEKSPQNQHVLSYNPKRRRCGGRRRAQEGMAAVPLGGGGAWPGFAATRRAKLAAQTARGRAAAHRHTQRPGPTTRPSRRPEHQRHQSTRQQAPHERAQAYKKPTSAIGCRPVVELGGFEPPTFSLRTRRATNCAIAPRTRTA